MKENTTKFFPNIAQSFGITGIVILGMIVFSPLNFLLNQIMGTEASMLIYYLLSIGVPFWIIYSIRKGKTGVQSFNLSMKNKQIIPWIVIGAIALLFGIVSPISSLIPMPESIQKMFMDFAGNTGVFSFILMVIAAPVLEELIFRGIILDGLLKKYSPVLSIFISSLLFGLVHLNPWQFVTGLIIGIFSGWIYYKTRSLSYSIIIHAAANLSGFIMRFFIGEDSSVTESALEMYGGLTNLLLVTGGSIVVITICIYFLRIQFNKQAD
ncbi:MAG: type II CAAX endopeptidase family protein [Bacteroidales bacterium]|jgi:membrane protease YdiL (CAAX protease family)|nr:type II CAAX endopeptidase family protein [Bacteroidales bacterium]